MVKPVFTRKWVGALQHFWWIYVNDILLIGNNVEFSGKHKGVFERSFSNKDLGEATYILSIKIYRDRSRRLISFFNEYIPWQDFKVVQNESKKEFLPVLQGVKLSKTQSPTTQKIEREWKSFPMPQP